MISLNCRSVRPRLTIYVCQEPLRSIQLERQDAGNGDSSNGAIYGMAHRGLLAYCFCVLKSLKQDRWEGRKNREEAEFLFLMYRGTVGSCIHDDIAVLTLQGMNRTLKPLKVKSLIFFQSIDKTNCSYMVIN